MDQVNILIIGGGVVGCAIAEVLSHRWQDVFLVEQFPKLGMSTSTRNSGVIHSGIYYPTNSWKARHCVEGNHLTKEFCEKHNVAHRTTGKLVIAKSKEEEPQLLALMKKGQENGVEGLEIIDAAEIRAKEPHVHAYSALNVPSTGICSAEELVHAYARLAEQQGANLLTRAKVEMLEPRKDLVRVTLCVGDKEHSETETVEARCVINAAGLYSDEVARLLGPRPWTIYPVRGEYCEIRGPRAELVRNLVYPLPHADGLSLGLHFTKTMWGTLLLGPTAKYVDSKDNYERDRMTIPEFADDVKHMVPEIKEADLQLAYTGLRPKLVPPSGKGIVDFVIEPDHEFPQVIQLVGIESPGLTAAPAIARHVLSLTEKILN
ncbi:MAG TPA: NAD(P)/FAD-dependent oxidoreductase [Candidatus Acidoferrum sp.]|nr:NAD(P)/FAD-dependent oxidoreductase [Candidatus Acidoferrum sp.]